jgi:hypothetical protein
MPILSEHIIKKILLEEYKGRLLEVLEETEVIDDRGNMVIGKDLKIRHKTSQFEYTVDDVLEDPDSGDIQIALRMPEDPRVEPAPEDHDVLTDIGLEGPEVLGEQDPASTEDITGTHDDAPDTSLGQEEIFFIDQEEFEKEYEVK